MKKFNGDCDYDCNSELVDRFYGLLKSHVTCKCGKESVTFDPFNTLCLPVPVKTARPLTIVVRLLPPGTPHLNVTIEVEPTDSVSTSPLFQPCIVFTNHDTDQGSEAKTHQASRETWKAQ